MRVPLSGAGISVGPCLLSAHSVRERTVAVPLKGGAWRETSMALLGMAFGMCKEEAANAGKEPALKFSMPLMTSMKTVFDRLGSSNRSSPASVRWCTEHPPDNTLEYDVTVECADSDGDEEHAGDKRESLPRRRV